MIVKTILTAAIAIWISLAASNATSAQIYSEPDKRQTKIAYAIYDAKCPSSQSIKEIYLCALKTIGDGKEQSKKSKEILIMLSSQNISDASYSLFENRRSLGIKDKDAIQYLIKSAEEGYAAAQVELGILFLNGKLVKQDSKESYNWLKAAAEKGNYDGMRYVSKCYFSGTGVDRNDAMGLYWLNKLFTDYGKLFDEWDMLGEAYETGRGTPVDLVKAYMFYDLEGTAGIEEKARIAPQMTSEQRAAGLRLSREWQEKNHVYTMQSLGLSRQSDGSYR